MYIYTLLTETLKAKKLRYIFAEELHAHILLFIWKFWENSKDVRGCFLL